MDKFRLFKITALLLVIFVGGAAAGILLDRHYAPRRSASTRTPAAPPVDHPDVLLKEFTAVMNLSPDQQQRVGVLLKDWGKEIGAHPEWTRAQRVSFIASNRPLMLTNLTAEQIVIYDGLVDRTGRRRSR